MEKTSTSSKLYHWLNNTDEPGTIFCSTTCKKFKSSEDGKTYILIETDNGQRRWVAEPECQDVQSAQTSDTHTNKQRLVKKHI